VTLTSLSYPQGTCNPEGRYSIVNTVKIKEGQRLLITSWIMYTFTASGNQVEYAEQECVPTLALANAEQDATTNNDKKFQGNQRGPHGPIHI